MILDDDLNPISERTFRQDKARRDELRAFLATDTGQQFIWILRKKLEIKGTSVPNHEAIPTISVAELSRLRGCQEMLTLILSLKFPPETAPVQQSAPPALGSWTEADLPPAIQVSKPTTR